jgi:hypothetical protein
LVNVPAVLLPALSDIAVLSLWSWKVTPLAMLVTAPLPNSSSTSPWMSTLPNVVGAAPVSSSVVSVALPPSRLIVPVLLSPDAVTVVAFDRAVLPTSTVPVLASVEPIERLLPPASPTP